MKNRYSIPAAALFLLLATGCDNPSSGTARQLEELERKANDAIERQLELERQLADQKLAAEREAIERERMLIEDERLELERQQGESAAAEAEALRQREQQLANREGKLQQIQADLEEKEALLTDCGVELNDRDRELAGREAIPFVVTESTVPVADYGMFYDSLSSYGSWYETPDYGYVWQPAVVSDSNWRPYSRGRWVCSDRGWTWVSEEPFGWATYHYGRWALVRGRGWVWVPGTEWAPCWVSWRESGSHIGWAPLPPETMAYRNHRWDSTVDEQFGIGAVCFNFVEIRHFGSPLYQHCLPVSRNSLFIKGTLNITSIHLVDRQVICGGPQFQKINQRLGRPIPFYRLELEGRARQNRESSGMHSRIKGDHLMVSAPNMGAAWNDGLRPARVKERIDKLEVERNAPLRPEIADRFKKNREEGQRIARRSMEELGGPEKFKQGRAERLEENRKQVEQQTDTPVKQRDPGKIADRTPREQPARLERPTENRVAGESTPARKPDPVRESRPLPPVAADLKPPDAEAPAAPPRPPRQETPDPRPVAAKPRQLDRDPRVQQETAKQPQAPRPQESRESRESREKVSGLKNKDALSQARKSDEARPRERGESARKPDDAPRGVQMDDLRKHQAEQEKLRQAQQANEAREAANRQKADQQQQERQREQAREAALQKQAEKQAREVREQAVEQQRQREEARESARQKQAEQQQEMQRQQERAQRQMEQQQQQQQQEAERQQERGRQRQQEESQRQQQQDRERQQEQSRQRERQETQRQQEKTKAAESEKERTRDSERSRNR
jgi:hypothetical protein